MSQITTATTPAYSGSEIKTAPPTVAGLGLTFPMSADGKSMQITPEQLAFVDTLNQYERDADAGDEDRENMVSDSEDGLAAIVRSVAPMITSVAHVGTQTASVRDLLASCCKGIRHTTWLEIDSKSYEELQLQLQQRATSTSAGGSVSGKQMQIVLFNLPTGSGATPSSGSGAAVAAATATATASASVSAAVGMSTSTSLTSLDKALKDGIYDTLILDVPQPETQLSLLLESAPTALARAKTIICAVDLNNMDQDDSPLMQLEEMLEERNFVRAQTYRRPGQHCGHALFLRPDVFLGGDS